HRQPGGVRLDLHRRHAVRADLARPAVGVFGGPVVDLHLRRSCDDGPAGADHHLDVRRRADIETRVPGCGVRESLMELLASRGGRLGFLIELKNYPRREMPLVERTIAEIEAHRAQDYVVLAGFDHVTLAEIHRLRPAWPLEMIVIARLADPVHAARAAGASLISLEPEFCLEPDVHAIHAAGLSVLTTLLDRQHARELLRMGVDVFESEDVAMVASALGVAPRV